MKDLTLNSQDAIQALTGFIQKVVGDAGYSKVVLGVSGGIDSALSAFLAVRALGQDNVLALRLPYRTSSPESLEHAQQVIDKLGCPSKTIEITGAVDAILHQHPEATPVRRGNVMARVRMINIYDQSAAFPGLVIGTGNKTETLLGYSTIHGDGAFDFNPLSDLYKAQVRQLSEDLGVPESIITKAPSADLWAGQTDEDEIGYTYTDMDQIFYCLVEDRYTKEDCLNEGFAPDFVDVIIKRIKQYRFKSILPRAGSVGQFSLGSLEELPFYNE
jgi:NAD+ synthase